MQQAFPTEQWRKGSKMPVHDPANLVFIVWMNPDHPKKPQSRLLMTHFDPITHLPLAFVGSHLQNSSIFSQIPIQSSKNFASALLDSTARNPVLIPVPIAVEQLGWQDYSVSTDTFGA
jgi:hypothetical protein